MAIVNLRDVAGGVLVGFPSIKSRQAAQRLRAVPSLVLGKKRSHLPSASSTSLRRSMYNVHAQTSKAIRYSAIGHTRLVI